LDPDHLGQAVRAGRQALSPAEFYDVFSPYLTAKVDEKKKARDPAWARREAVLDGLGADYISWYPDDGDEDDEDDDEGPPLDPRWLDLAVKLRHLGLVNAAGRPGHPAAEAFLDEEFHARFEKVKNQDQMEDVLTVMVHHQHPRAADALVASYEKTIGKANASTYWYHDLIRGLPKAALSRLESVVPRLKGPEADQFVEALEKLRNKKD
jgi:hypothetical protein